MRRKIEYGKAQVRAKVEHAFRVIKRQFGYTKERVRSRTFTTIGVMQQRRQEPAGGK